MIGTRYRSIAVMSAGLFVAAVLAGPMVRAEEAHHTSEVPAGGSPSPGAPPAQSAMPMGGMKSGEQMPMMKMMQDMHAKMMGSGMSMMPKGDTGPSSMALSGAMAKMHQDMGMTFTGNADIDFVKAMTIHHQGAIDMAKTAIAFGKDAEVKRFAEGIIKAQEAEMAWSNEWLKKQGQ